MLTKASILRRVLCGDACADGREPTRFSGELVAATAALVGTATVALMGVLAASMGAATAALIGVLPTVVQDKEKRGGEEMARFPAASMTAMSGVEAAFCPFSLFFVEVSSGGGGGGGECGARYKNERFPPTMLVHYLEPIGHLLPF